MTILKTRALGTNAQTLHKFENGYGASVIIGPWSYGGDQGLYELAVVQFTEGDSYELCYSTPITDDVLGYLTDEEVKETLAKIEAL